MRPDRSLVRLESSALAPTNADDASSLALPGPPEDLFEKGIARLKPGIHEGLHHRPYAGDVLILLGEKQKPEGPGQGDPQPLSTTPPRPVVHDHRPAAILHSPR